MAVSDPHAAFNYPTDQDNYETSVHSYNHQNPEETCSISATEDETNENALELTKNEELAKLKAEKKGAKKKRQKERKKVEKANNSCDAENKNNITAQSKISLNSVLSCKTSKTKTADNASNEKVEIIDKEEEADDEFLDLNAAFVKVSVKQNKHITLNKPTVSKPNKVNRPEAIKSSASLPQSGKLDMSKANHDTAEILGIQSCKLVLVDKDFYRAVKILTQAILLAPDDPRHYINRSYCYLRLGQYTAALNDVQFVKKNARTMEQSIKALAREGQALRGLKQYHEAEKCFEELLKLDQRIDWVLGELVLVRLMQLTSMGFSKMDSLKALKQCSSVTDAVTLLTSGNISSSELESNINTPEIQNCDGDEVYFSDDESSSTILLSKLISDISYESSYYKNLRSQPFSSSKAQEFCSSLERSLKSSISMESLQRTNDNDQWEVQGNSKSLMSTYKPQKPKVIANDSSTIWVGNIEKNVTDLKLRELFSRFGSINYIRRFPDKRFVFIDFKSKKAATKALNSMINFQVNGIQLPVKPSTGSLTNK
ncbi:uncharacterized protein [Neodiprion pinetum]|uniref:uncharacterized protein isoform X1 n=1 Tax=Neodiprion pinetum TaxID=441929 RepID=UPI001EDE8B9A|nr:uncharacterized protein LOC124212922 isoform X1 [Neodiprion pinetum]XP_046469512.1 uncharacterized protein LOC124212922 isoform X1 [Neodiprion pinetum]